MNREKGLITLEWIPRMKSKTNSQIACPTNDQTCCKRTGGEYWKVYAANGWDIWDDAEWAAAREVAQDAANYCPACYKKDMGRLKVGHNYYGPYMKKRLKQIRPSRVSLRYFEYVEELDIQRAGIVFMPTIDLAEVGGAREDALS